MNVLLQILLYTRHKSRMKPVDTCGGVLAAIGRDKWVCVCLGTQVASIDPLLQLVVGGL